MKTSRKAISPVLATVILIAITLIAAIAIAGFVFGLFGTFGGRQEATVSSILSADGGRGPSGYVTVYNSGTKNVAVAQVTLTYGGQTCYASWAQQFGSFTQANSNAQLDISAATYPSDNGCGTPGMPSMPQPGESYVGQVILTDGSALPFTGDFQ